MAGMRCPKLDPWRASYYWDANGTHTLGRSVDVLYLLVGGVSYTVGKVMEIATLSL